MSPVTILLQKRSKLLLPAPGPHDARSFVVTMERNIRNLGFTFTRRLAEALASQPKDYLAALYAEMVEELKRQKGAHVDFRPMYPNFPDQVASMSDTELYWNALFHYITLGDPNTAEKEARQPLAPEEGKLLPIDLGYASDIDGLFVALAQSNASLSETDKGILAYLAETLPHAENLLPAVIPQRETQAILAATFLKKDAAFDLTRYTGTATDVLRVATHLSGGDISLAENTRYAKFPRLTRRALLAALEACGESLEEDMLRHAGRWIRLGEVLHPGQYPRYPRALAAFVKLRKSEPIPTFNSVAESMLAPGSEWDAAVTHLGRRPGEFLRRLDHLLRTQTSHGHEILRAFLAVADRCATPALLNLAHHFRNRPDKPATRAVFPKGSTAKMQVIPAVPGDLPGALCAEAVEGIDKVLRERFGKLPPLGRVYIDPALWKYPIPAAQRSDSRALRTLPKGSRAPLDQGAAGKYLRFFIYWKNGNGRTDVDLSCAFLKADFSLSAEVTYYNLSAVGGLHSGDIVDAPQGASEFIDVEIDLVRATGARYVAAVIFSYSGQSLRSLPECFFGWMTRDDSQRGEIFEAKTVRNKADLSGDTGCAVPVLIDLETREVIWCDIATKGHPGFPANVENNKRSLSHVCKHFAYLNKPSLYALLRLHAEARGEIVDSPEAAQKVFMADFAYEGNVIAAEFLG